MKKVSEAQANTRLRTLRLMHNWTQADVAEKINTTSLNVSRWERGILVPSLHFRQKLCELFGKSSEELGLFREEESLNQALLQGEAQNSPALSLPDFPHFWYVPYQRNPFFTGREEVLQYLHTVSQEGKMGTFAHPYALCGLGGIGKTQIALEYTYRSASVYSAIFWIRADTKEHILADFSSVAAMLSLPEKDDSDQNSRADAVKRWLCTHAHWLLIFDDVEAPELVKRFLPTTHNATILLTTQRATLGNIALPIELKQMPMEDATLFLLRRSRILERASSQKQISPADKLAARKLAEMMDGLPLALDQAGAYINENKCTLTEFLYLFQEYPFQLLDERGCYTDHPLSVVQTVSRAFEQLQQKNSAAANLLILCCFLDPDAIPEALFLENAARPLFQPFVANLLQFNSLLKELLSSSIIYRKSETRTLTIHYLVQIVLKGQLDEQMRRQWADQAIKMVHQTFPVDRSAAPTITLFTGVSQALSS